MKTGRKHGAGLAIAVTGGIACGKSEAGRVLAAAGASVRDADEVAHAAIDPGGSAYEAVVERFGKGVLDSGGHINRKALGAVVFRDRESRLALNALVHPVVMKELRHWIAQEVESGRDAVALIPLLFEIDAAEGWDFILCIAADEAVARRRLEERGLSAKEAGERIAAQWPLAEKVKRADVTIWNNGTLDAFQREVESVYSRIRERNEHG